MEQAPLYGRFRLAGRLGAGGMGVVYRAYDLRREEWIALKTLDKVSLENLMNLKREFRVASLLHHPNLVRFYDLLSDGISCAIGMELIEGQNLISYIRNVSADAPTVSVDAPTAPSADAALPMRVMRAGIAGASYHLARLLASLPQLCLAIDALHQEGLVHRDLKPSNVLCTPSGLIKLLDFGTTRAFRGTWGNDEGRLIEGTPHYMSPEQARGERVGPPSDLYSLGVLLYVLLTGLPPFQGQTTRRILEKHLSEAPQPPSRLAKGIPNELEELCLLLLQKDPLQRPTARELAARLADLGAPALEFPKSTTNRFVGRTQELTLLSESAEEVSRGARRAVFIGGESGAGKSALVGAMARKLSLANWRVLAGRCYERESVPYNALDSLLDTLSSFAQESPSAAAIEGVDELVAMFPVLRDSLRIEPAENSAVGARLRAAAAFRGLLGLFSKGKPLILWIDDLQWADSDSLELLTRLFEGEAASSLLLLGTYRTTQEPSEELTRLLAQGFARSLSIGPLGVEAIKGLVGGSAEKAAKIAQESQGNAFFASELAYAVQSGEALQSDLNSLLLSRVKRLSQPLQQTMETAAAAGGAVSFETLKQVTGLGASSLSRALDDLRYGRWLRTLDDSFGEASYDVYHDRIREVLYNSLEPGKKGLLHLSFAASLEEAGEPEAIANHYLRAEVPAQAAPWLLRAAQKAANQLAAERASTLYLQAIEAGGEAWRYAQRAREERAFALDRAGGKYKEAAQAYREAASYLKGSRNVRLLVRAAEAELKLGAIDSALKAAILAMAPYEKLILPQGTAAAFTESIWLNLNVEWYLKNLTTIPNRGATQHDTLKHLLLHRMAGVFLYFDLMQGTVLAMRSLVLALSRGSTEDLIDAITLYAAFVGLRRGRANLDRAQELFQRCQPAFYALKEPEVDVWVRDGLPSMLAVLSGDAARAKDLLHSTISRYRSIGRGAGHEMTTFQSMMAYCEGSLGNPRAGIDFLTPLFSVAVQEQEQMSLRGYALPLSFLYLLTGDLDNVWKTARELPPQLKYQALLTGMPTAYHQAGALLMEGKAQDAISLLQAILAEPLENGLIAFGEAKIRARVLLGLAHLSLSQQATGPAQRKEHLSLAWRVVSTVVHCDDAVLEGITFRVAGLIARARGDHAAAQTWLDKAVHSLEMRGEAVELAAALLARGGSDDLVRGKALLQRGGFVDPALREGFAWRW